jgi:hypothetical protein
MKKRQTLLTEIAGVDGRAVHKGHGCCAPIGPGGMGLRAALQKGLVGLQKGVGQSALQLAFKVCHRAVRQPGSYQLMHLLCAELSSIFALQGAEMADEWVSE